MDTKAFFPAVQHVAREPKAIGFSRAHAVQSARWWPLILLFAAFHWMSGCDRKIPEPGEPIIERQNEDAAPDDRSRSHETDPGAQR